MKRQGKKEELGLESNMELKEIEKSIIKKYRKDIWRKFTKAVTDYKLINDNDKIAVCISGGKDSFILAKCLQEIKKHGKIKFDLEYICMDPGYDEVSSKKIKENAEKLGINLNIFNTNIFETVSKISEKAPCYLCARMRRGYLYDEAKKRGCNKIALGHHYDDVIETILLGMLYGGQIGTMLPKLKSQNFEGLELIRPLYLVREKSIISWAKYTNMNFIGCACNLKEEDSKRKEIKELIKELSQKNEFIEGNIFKSVENINLGQVMGYKNNNYIYNYIEEYD